MRPFVFSADCGRCVALCCVALAFDRSAFFAFDKAAGVACSHLDAERRCRIHAERDARGFAGCSGYDCLGAGQLTTALFAGRSRAQEPEAAADMLEAFRVLREIMELALLLHTAERLSLAPEQHAQRREWLRVLNPDAGWSLSELRDFEGNARSHGIREFLKSLRGAVTDGARRRLPLVAVGGA